ncbi:Alcohol dehydrogenase GroES-like domain-containing protein [[Luteovulum] sphaeroides subsp. megalophilum]|uniref:alcohol dehydrogenase catalytic domain-containing protein n=1 Tax=Cereibacter sphaeroides TaxID=1063 RepID=UPI000B71E598|nr:alcohol dehydrogenase catalytic domain-containing protein [Cereibacter sphaeroides]SNT26717.1 Alcohol dehydrogenase GroES-like domain-containing protein [[Luteovulum] sphaeroides subsp. megalophilum]
MKAAIFDGSPTLRLTDLPIQEPGPDEVLIRIDSATICGTDQHILEGKFWAKPPVVLGHEFAGFVERVGERVQNCKPGDLVSVEPHVYCGCCKPCRLGKPHLCLDRLAWGINLNGGFEQYATVRMDTVYQVPEGIGPEEAALGEITGCCMHGIDRVGVELGDLVVILGGGAAGLILARLAELRGAARIVISEPNAARREQIRAFGYPDVVDPLKDPAPAPAEGHRDPPLPAGEYRRGLRRRPPRRGPQDLHQAERLTHPTPAVRPPADPLPRPAEPCP